ncbi:MAG TPA: hypothetical protein VIV60_17290, partial [Polyangiaceae bacterium]
LLAGALVACTNVTVEEHVPTDVDAPAMAAQALESSNPTRLGATELDPDFTPPRDVYLTSFTATFQYQGVYAHTVYLYQPLDGDALVRFDLRSEIAGAGLPDASSTFRDVKLLTNPSQPGQTEQTLTATTPTAGTTRFDAMTHGKGWYALTFVYESSSSNRALSYSAVDAQGKPAKTVWVAPSGKTAKFRVAFQADTPNQVYFKGGAFSGASIQQFAYMDNITVDGRLLYRKGFDQGLFNYPVGYLTSPTHSLEFDFSAWSGAPSQSWFGVSHLSYDPKQREAEAAGMTAQGIKTSWDRAQFLYQGPMRTSDYDAWNEGVAFAQSNANVTNTGTTFPILGVRPPPVRRGTNFAVALEHQLAGGQAANATLEISLLGNSSLLGWSRSISQDYTGGTYTASGFSTCYREHWSVYVPVDAPIGRYVLRAFAPDHTQIGTDVLFYVIHNPQAYVGIAGLTKAEVETYGYDEDEDGHKWNLVEGASTDSDQDHLRDNFVVVVEPPLLGDNGQYLPADHYSGNAGYSGAFRRSTERSLVDHSLLDYAMASAHGATTEFETMLRLLRYVNQRKRYYNSSIPFVPVEEELSLTFATDVEQVLPLANACSLPGYDASAYVSGGAVCYTFATLLGAFTRSTGLLSRAINAGVHAVTEVYLPTPPNGTSFPDSDRWFVFDATDHKSNPEGPYAGAEDPNTLPSTYFTNLWESVAPRGQYCLAEQLMAASDGWSNGCNWVTTSVDWEAPTAPGSFQLSAQGGKDLTAEYNANSNYRLTASGATGWLSFGAKHVYRLNKTSVNADYIRVRALPSFGSSNLVPELCILPSPFAGGVTGMTRCADAANVRRIPSGESYVIVFNDSENLTRYHGDVTQYRIELGSGAGWERCDDGVRNGQELAIDCGGNCPGCAAGKPCNLASDCLSNVCDYGTHKCAASLCNAATAIDLGAPGHETVVSNDACVKVELGYPSWWGSRTMSLQNSGASSFPLPFTWSNSCSSSSGQASFTANWQSRLMTSVSSQCANVIDLQGDGNSNVTLRYYGQ